MTPFTLIISTKWLYQSVKKISDSLHNKQDNIFQLDYNELICSESNCVVQLNSFLRINDIDAQKISSIEVDGVMGDPKAMIQNEGIRSKKSFWYQKVNSPIKYLILKKFSLQHLMTTFISQE